MLHAFALVLVLSSSLAAQPAVKQAVAEVKTATKLAVKELRDQAKQVYETFDANLDALEQSYVEGDIQWNELARFACNELVALQVELAIAWPAKVHELFEGTVTDVLLDLPVGSDEIPLDFVLGTGGALDDALAGLRGVADKQLATASKRLKKTAKLLAKQDDVVMLWRAVRPDVNDHFVVGQGAPVFVHDTGGLAIHTLLSASQRTETQDGVLCIAGWGVTGTVTVDYGFTGAEFSEPALIEDQTHVWSLSLGSLPESNYAIAAHLGNDEVSVVNAFGIP